MAISAIKWAGMGVMMEDGGGGDSVILNLVLREGLHDEVTRYSKSAWGKGYTEEHSRQREERSENHQGRVCWMPCKKATVTKQMEPRAE